MARFRAFESDSSSSSEDEQEAQQLNEKRLPSKPQPAPAYEPEDDQEEEEEEEEEEAESSESEGSSGILEEELIPRRSRSRKALFQDENGDFQVTGDDEDSDERDSSPSSSRSSPPVDPRAVGPGQNIIPWARHVGVDAQKMHVMQTSLFRMPEEAAALKALNQPPAKRRTVAALNLGPPSLNRKHSRDSEGDGLSTGSTERASFAHDMGPTALRPTRKYARIEITSSVANGKEESYVDAGLAFGRSFRVGWGPGGKLVHVGVICGPFASSPSSVNSSIVTLTKTPFPAIEPRQTAEISELASPATISEKLLQHHLTHTPISKNDVGIAVANPNSTPLNFGSFASLFPTTDTAGPGPLFKLGSAIFDPIDLRLGGRKQSSSSSFAGATAITPDVRNRVTLLRRRTALGQWLEHVVKPSADGDIRVKATGPISGGYTVADTVFSQLTGHQISEACTVAMDAGYLKLATLISQAGGDETFKADIRAQLQIWKDEKLAPTTGGGGLGAGSNGLISRGVWKVYRLLSGPVDQADEGWVEQVCAGLDWKRIFGLCLWYGMGVDTSVADIVRLYEGLTRRYASNLVARPLPRWQLEQSSGRQTASSSATPFNLLGSRPGMGLITSGSAVPSSHQQHDDPQYTLIRLHADPALSLSQALDPLSFGPDERWGGIAMCWHLYMILSRVMRVRDFADRMQAASSKGKAKVNGVPNGIHGQEDDDNIEEDSSPGHDGHSHTANLLTSAYAFELEGWGKVQEAAFVLLHLEASEGRRKAIKDLLARSAPSMDDWMTRGLVGSLKIPITWVHEAKAMHARSQGDIYNAYELYLSAQLWNSAHDLAVLELAPDAILRRDVDLLRELFEPFDLEGRRDKIDGWFVRGKIFVDYANVLTRVPQLQERLQEEKEGRADGISAPGEPSPAEELEDLMRKVPKLIALLPDILHRPRSVDDRHTAAIEEMTQSLLRVTGKAKPSTLVSLAKFKTFEHPY
ncbi:hypothetical protein EST38_g9671 [Candolleomyces aberdarensis]|uniref:Nuclear pore complex protein NUP96 C-terminal domain-containing protein n=1 Tax=Candolleomyces aberdarensis TaxID=2316362 RepID=A0A4Q2D9C1_9AGAR|nr:hypothetical protein EST38_g9671 [Candolleomyces aberdarensis]